MNPGPDYSIKERVRRLIASQRQVNELVYRFSREVNDHEIQQTLDSVINRGNENIQVLARLLAVKCGS